MRRLGTTIGFILIAGYANAFGQSKSEMEIQELTEQRSELERKAKEAAVLAQLGQSATPWSIYSHSNQSKAGPSAALQTGLQGTWWREAHWIETLNLTPDQQKKMYDAFRQNRIKLIDLSAALEKAELMLEPLVENIRPGDEAKILGQIDQVANARAELEKANARMLLAIRQVLTQDQWNKLPSNKPDTLRFFYNFPK